MQRLIDREGGLIIVCLDLELVCSGEMHVLMVMHLVTRTLAERCWTLQTLVERVHGGAHALNRKKMLWRRIALANTHRHCHSATMAVSWQSDRKERWRYCRWHCSNHRHYSCYRPTENCTPRLHDSFRFHLEHFSTDHLHCSHARRSPASAPPWCHLARVSSCVAASLSSVRALRALYAVKGSLRVLMYL